MKTREKVARKIKNMQGYVKFLREHSASEDDLLKDYLLKSAIERNLQLAIESALDIGEVEYPQRIWINQKTIAV
jgi:uncharacterized protein YutE (UPF0331/DUF86 family)